MNIEEQQEWIDKKLRLELSDVEEQEFMRLIIENDAFNKLYQEEKEFFIGIQYARRDELLNEFREVEDNRQKQPLSLSWKKALPLVAGLALIIAGIYFIGFDNNLNQGADKIVDLPNDIDTNGVNIVDDTTEALVQENIKELNVIDTNIKATIDNQVKDKPILAQKNEPYETEIPVFKVREDQGFGYNSTDRPSEFFKVKVNYKIGAPLKYKFTDTELLLQGEIDQKEPMKLIIMKSLEGDTYMLELSDQRYKIVRSNSFKVLK